MIVTKVAAVDRPKNRYVYLVAGSGPFPIDMLRFDGASPYDTDAVTTLGRKDKREIRLSSYRSPTYDRWRSFGWTVT